MVYIISVFFSFIVVVFLTPLLTNFLSSLELVDKPDNDRKIHSLAIPRMGGIIIYSVVISFLLLTFPSTFNIKFFIIGSLIIFLLGIADDLWNLKWNYKFIVQFFVASFLILYLIEHNYFDFNFFGIDLPLYLTYPIIFFLIIGTLNSFNLMDGMDGLVSGFSLIITSMSFIISYSSDFIFVPLLSILVIGTTLGFLKFNSNPAKIFLGDSGALTLAYFCLIALLSSTAEISRHKIDLTFIGMVLSVPLIDTLRVMILRIKNRKNPFLPDKNHLHHIIYSKKIRHKTTVAIILSITVLSQLIALYYLFSSKVIGTIIFILFASALFMVDKILNFILMKDNLLLYGRMIKLLPSKFAEIFKFYILPVVVFLVVSLIFYLLFSKVPSKDTRFFYLLIFNVLTILYVYINLKRHSLLSDIFVFINFTLFFYTVSLGDLFYGKFTVPMIGYFNLNQVFVIIIIPTLIFYIFFKDKISNKRDDSFFSGLDMIIALLIIAVYMFIKFSGFGTSYLKISDVLIRSFLVYSLYKVVINCYPKTRFKLYFTSYAFIIIMLLRTIIS